jgi:hypothetical protein
LGTARVRLNRFIYSAENDILSLDHLPLHIKLL